MDTPTTFHCSACGLNKPRQTEGGTGYATNDKGELICYACCAECDRRDMRQHGTITLYLTHDHFDGHRIAQYDNWRDGTVSNWPGTLTFPCRVKRSHHNIARWRYDAWFTFEGQNWHGVSYGDNTQIIRCKRLKGRA